jgi:hypothetical protein
MPRIRKRTGFLALLSLLLFFPAAARAAYDDYPVVKLQSLDKITARTMVFEAHVGSTVKFGPIYIKIQACRKAPPIEQPESAAFLQIWEVTPQEESKWIFSGWMFASSPALSSMNHPVYDVWVIDCLQYKTGEEPPPAADNMQQPPDTPPPGDATPGAPGTAPAKPADAAKKPDAGAKAAPASGKADGAPLEPDSGNKTAAPVGAAPFKKAPAPVSAPEDDAPIQGNPAD